MHPPKHFSTSELAELARAIRVWGAELGFQAVGIADIDLSRAEAALLEWLEAGYHGEMAYMAQHGQKRTRPAELVEGTVRVISVRMDYLPEPAEATWALLADPSAGYIARYALGRDYHKLMRRRLQRLAERIGEVVGPYRYRAFSDSAPVMERPLAEKAGLGWVGKHTLLLTRGGSWFFLGELYVDLPLPADRPVSAHCGSCSACIDVCPTGAIVGPYRVDARRCISYLTIELHDSIPVPLRPLMGNRVYGCDDCQLVCPWNRHARQTQETDFLAREGLDAPRLLELFRWDEATFLRRTEGSALRRLGHERWLRNLAVALGNAPTAPEITQALKARLEHPSPLVREHVQWALAQQKPRGETTPSSPEEDAGPTGGG